MGEIVGSFSTRFFSGVFDPNSKTPHSEEKRPKELLQIGRYRRRSASCIRPHRRTSGTAPLFGLPKRFLLPEVVSLSFLSPLYSLAKHASGLDLCTRWEFCRLVHLRHTLQL